MSCRSGPPRTYAACFAVRNWIGFPETPDVVGERQCLPPLFFQELNVWLRPGLPHPHLPALSALKWLPLLSSGELTPPPGASGHTRPRGLGTGRVGAIPRGSLWACDAGLSLGDGVALAPPPAARTLRGSSLHLEGPSPAGGGRELGRGRGAGLLCAGRGVSLAASLGKSPVVPEPWARPGVPLGSVGLFRG